MKFQIKGVTLLEMLLVLLISIFLLELFSGSQQVVFTKTEEALFLRRFERTYQEAQFMAGASQQPQEISLVGRFLIYKTQKVPVPDQVKVTEFTVKFDKNGNNSSLQKISIRLLNLKQTVTYQLQMGSGKYVKTIS